MAKLSIVTGCNDASALGEMVKDCRHEFFGDGKGIDSKLDFVEWFYRVASFPILGYVNGELATITYLCGYNGHRAAIHCLVSPKFRSPSISVKLGKMCFDKYFSELPIRKLEGVVAEYNRPARIMCRRLGFKQDGILREHIKYNGEWRNCVLYSLLRSEIDGQ